VTIAITPSFAADSDEVVDAFLDRVFCGSPRRAQNLSWSGPVQPSAWAGVT
jgi:hypothetical protein